MNETPAQAEQVAPVDPQSPTDTATPATNEADVQVNEAPEATQDQGDPEVKATDTAEERLYAGKYKSVDDLESSYKELQSKATRDAQDKAELTRILNDAFTEEPATPDESYIETEVDPRIEKLERQGAVSSFIMTHPNANGEAINKVLAEDPFISKISGHEAKLEYAYLKSQNMTQPKVVAEAQKASADAARLKVAEKQAAQVETVRQQAAPTSDSSHLSQSELRDALRDENSFHDLMTKKYSGISKMTTKK